MRLVYWQFTVLIGVGIVLLAIDRATRIQSMLNPGKRLYESFQMPVLWSGAPKQCGVGIKSCPDPTKCGNGFCINTDPAPLVERSPIPVLPPFTQTFQ